MIRRRRISHPPFRVAADVATATPRPLEEAATARLDEIREDAALAIVERFVDLREPFEDDDADLRERRVGLAADPFGRGAVERLAAEQARISLGSRSSERASRTVSRTFWKASRITFS